MRTYAANLLALLSADPERAARGATNTAGDVGTAAERGPGQAAGGAADAADNVGGALQGAAEETRDVHGSSGGGEILVGIRPARYTRA